MESFVCLLSGMLLGCVGVEQMQCLDNKWPEFPEGAVRHWPVDSSFSLTNSEMEANIFSIVISIDLIC